MRKPKLFDVVEGTHGLCHRCEHRAKWNEDQTHRPRYECGAVTAVQDLKGIWTVRASSVHACYMYEPVKPLVLKPNDGDKRPPMMGWMLAARSHAVGLPTAVRSMVCNGTQFVTFWMPCRKKDIKARFDIPGKETKHALHTARRPRKV